MSFFPFNLKALNYDLTQAVFDFLGIDDLLIMEQCADWVSWRVHRFLADFGNDQIPTMNITEHSKLCSGCCQYAAFDPESMHMTRFFVYIGDPGGCFWKGFVPSTCSSLLLGAVPGLQSALVSKSQAFKALYQLLTEESNKQRILNTSVIENNHESRIRESTKAVTPTTVTSYTPGLHEIIERITSSVTIRVIATFPEQKLVMAATPESRHLKIHWDDTSYNSHYQEIGWADAILSTSKSTKQKRPACLHLWFTIFPNKPAELSYIRVNKCTWQVWKSVMWCN